MSAWSDRYELQERIGAGGMAEVFRARARSAVGLDKTVVIKRIRADESLDADLVHMLLDEARLSLSLHHPNIVQVYECGAVDGQPFMAMEYVPGCDLARLQRTLATQGRRLPVDLAVWIAHELARALDYAHGRVGPDGASLGVVHRDVCPANVLLSDSGEVRLTDFGIARSRWNLFQTQGTGPRGHLSYMSPEQTRVSPLDGRSDLFSLGVVLHELLTGQRLFRRAGGSDTLRAVQGAPIPSPGSLRDDVPPALDAVVMRALSRDLGQRTGSARALVGELGAWLSLAEADRLRGVLAGLVLDVRDAQIARAAPIVAGGEADVTVVAGLPELVLSPEEPEEDVTLLVGAPLVGAPLVGAPPDLSLTPREDVTQLLPASPPAGVARAPMPAVSPEPERAPDRRLGARWVLAGAGLGLVAGVAAAVLWWGGLPSGQVRVSAPANSSLGEGSGPADVPLGRSAISAPVGVVPTEAPSVDPTLPAATATAPMSPPMEPTATEPTETETSATGTSATETSAGAAPPTESMPPAEPTATEPTATEPPGPEPVAGDPPPPTESMPPAETAATASTAATAATAETATEPTATDPTATDPTATDPTATDLTATDLTATDLTATEPATIGEVFVVLRGGRARLTVDGTAHGRVDREGVVIPLSAGRHLLLVEQPSTGQVISRQVDVVAGERTPLVLDLGG